MLVVLDFFGEVKNQQHHQQLVAPSNHQHHQPYTATVAIFCANTCTNLCLGHDATVVLHHHYYFRRQEQQEEPRLPQTEVVKNLDLRYSRSVPPTTGSGQSRIPISGS